MSLREYIRKRSFEKTPEPQPGKERAKEGVRRFCVQRHHARQLHYDFRLESGGVLKSWAIPKGPTLDPSKKRLAMLVEDHPLDYGDFEGNIPAGNYGAGSVMLWDGGTYELLGDKGAEEQLARGDLKFRLHGQKLEGEFALVQMKGRGKGNEWLLLKKKDSAASPEWDAEEHARSILTGRTQEEIAREVPPMPGNAPKAKASGKRKAPKLMASKLPGAVKAGMPASVAPMQAHSMDSVPKEDDWLFEIKWDGVRAICFLEGGIIRLQSRKGTFVEKQYPELSVIHESMAADSAILDGEIAILDEQGLPSFPMLQSRITAGDAGAIAHLARKRPVSYFAFDLLYLDGYDLRQTPLIERKRALQTILSSSSLLKYSEHITGMGEQFLKAAQEKGLEGIVAKRAGSPYESKRSRNWLKIKIVNQQEFLICGMTEGEREFFGSLMLGIYDSGKLAYAGNVGTGFDRHLQEHISRLLQPLVSPRCPFGEVPKVPRAVSWVRPETVCMVRFASWTQDGRLRAPVFLGLRPDVEPRECVREKAQALPEEPAATVSGQPLLSGTAATVSLTIESRRLRFTNLNKVFFPHEAYTKRDVINYYDAVAGLILPHLRDRPLSLKRYPDGIEGEYFFQKEAAKSFPPWLRIEPIATKPDQKPTSYVVAEDRAGLLYLANLACIDQNPWLSRIGSLANPDFILVDLDAQECPYRLVVEAAQLVRQTLEALGLEGYPKTTGGDGMHICVPLEPGYTYEQTRSVAEVIARLLAEEHPDIFTTGRPVARRAKGKVYFDYLQNAIGQTIAAPYVLRAYPGAPVATPLEWREVVPALSPQQFHLGNAADRFARVGDLFSPVLTKHQRLEEAVERLGALTGKRGKRT